MKFSAVLLLGLLAAASAAPQFSLPAASSSFSQQSRSPVVPAPTLNHRTEQFDDAGQYTRSYQLSDGTVVQETGALKPNKDQDGLVLVTRGYFRYPTPLGEFWETEWQADENGYQILRSNAVPVAPIDEAHRTF